MGDCIDKLGTEILVGDIVIYGHNFGRSCALRVGKVLDVYFKEGSYCSQPSWKLKVIGISDDFNGIELCSKPGHLAYPHERVIVIERSMLDSKRCELLDGYKNG